MGNKQTFKRKELKYLISDAQKNKMLEDIEKYITPDPYPNYKICNVYMDTPDSLLIRRSIDKPGYKEKIRLRSYGMVSDEQKIHIELKKKFDGIVYKRRIKMQLGEAMAYLSGDASRCGQVESEIDYFINTYEGLEASMYISYDREAYHAVSDRDLRITFDDNILWRDREVTLSAASYGDKILDEGQSILEIKCADALPLWLARSLSSNGIYKTSFSKYGKAYIDKNNRDRKVLKEGY